MHRKFHIKEHKIEASDSYNNICIAEFHIRIVSLTLNYEFDFDFEIRVGVVRFCLKLWIV